MPFNKPIKVISSVVGRNETIPDIPDASLTDKGLVLLANDVEVDEGVDNTKAVTSSSVKSFYLPLDFSELTPLI